MLLNSLPYSTDFYTSESLWKSIFHRVFASLADRQLFLWSRKLNIHNPIMICNLFCKPWCAKFLLPLAHQVSGRVESLLKIIQRYKNVKKLQRRFKYCIHPILLTNQICQGQHLNSKISHHFRQKQVSFLKPNHFLYLPACWIKAEGRIMSAFRSPGPTILSSGQTKTPSLQLDLLNRRLVVTKYIL